jgi:hypothetical protein
MFTVKYFTYMSCCNSTLSIVEPVLFHLMMPDLDQVLNHHSVLVSIILS